MPNLVVNRPDRFPNGTVVDAYPASARKARGDLPPGGPILETQTVASNIATFTTLAADTPYTFYAAATGQYLNQRLSTTDLGKAVGTGDTTSGSAALATVAATSGTFQIGQRITGPGIPPGTFLIAGSGASWTMSDKATASATGVALEGHGAYRWRARLMRRRAALGTS